MAELACVPNTTLGFRIVMVAAAAATPRVACFGIAGPVLGDRVKVTHLPWEIDARELEQAKLIIAERSLRKGLAKYGRI